MSLQNVQVSYSTGDGTATYNPSYQQPPPAAAPPQPPQTATATATAATASAMVPVQQPAISMSVVEPPPKKKRGRPRKYAPADGGSIVSPPPPSKPVQSSGSGVSTSSGKRRGRPPGSSNKLKGLGGVGFTPHVITVKAGENVLAKLMSFSQSSTRAVCILSANGAISNVTLRQAATSGGTVTYEGRFEILSLAGSFLLSESGVQRSRTGGLSVSLAGPDGRVLGGGVAGLLTAASPVQVILGSFATDSEKQFKLGQAGALAVPFKHMSGAFMAGSPPSHGTLSESSGGPGSPFNQSVEAFNINNNENENNDNQPGIANIHW